ncbi:hypothetical protein N9L02_01065 [Gammaproteobacteria bacterium]|nr:hypothetical protein [Gammaproteobacteria bacterium]
MLSNSIIIQKKHSSFLFTTDLESDDIISELQLGLFLEKLPSNEDKKVNIAFVVGEGNSAIKVLRQEKMIENFKAIGLLKKCNLQIIRGYNSFDGSQKDFKTDGLESLSKNTVNLTLDKEAANKAKNENYENALRMQSDKEIINFLSANPNTAIINLKPPRELISISKTSAGNNILSKHKFYGTGSYNHRSLFDKNNIQAGQNELINLLNKFNETFIFETYSGHEENSTSIENSPLLFEMLANAKLGELLYYLDKFIDLWADHLLAADRLNLPKHLNCLVETKEIDVSQSEEIQKMFNSKKSDISNDQFSKCKQMVKSLVEKLKGNKIKLASAQKVDRLLKKWANITGCSKQFVNADPALTAIIFGNCPQTTYNFRKTKVSFNGSYTVLNENKDQSSNVHICLPGNLSVTDYNSLRKTERDTKQKPAILQEAQNGLFIEIQKDLLKTTSDIHSATQKLNKAKIAGLQTESMFMMTQEKVTSVTQGQLEYKF